MRKSADCLIFGMWKSSLSNTTNAQNAYVFNAAIEIIMPDGIGRYTHVLTSHYRTSLIQAQIK
jgi:hypothetical protein